MYTLDFGVPALIQGKKRVGGWVRALTDDFFPCTYGCVRRASCLINQSTPPFP